VKVAAALLSMEHGVEAVGERDGVLPAVGADDPNGRRGVDPGIRPDIHGGVVPSLSSASTASGLAPSLASDAAIVVDRDVARVREEPPAPVGAEERGAEKRADRHQALRCAPH
jgi:hypothetical protein